MRDPDFDVDPGVKWLDVRRHRGRRPIVIACVAFLGACWLALASHSNRRYTCAVCREGKVETRLLGLSWSRETETDCSQWYRENVEPSHAHAWAAHGYCRRFGIPGLWGGYGCSIGSPIAGLSERVQIDIYKHFQDRLEAKRLFLSVALRDDEDGRRCQALMVWIDADYPGTWQDWWEKHRGKDEG